MDDNSELLEYKGNEKEFEKQNKLLISEFDKKDKEIIYYEENIFPIFSSIFSFFSFFKKKKYEGEILNGIYSGRGILYEQSGHIKYNGYFKNGKYDGFGKLYEEGKLIYEGFFERNKYNGKGTLYYKNEKKYEGFFKEGKCNGIIIVYRKGKKIKKIIYENDNPKTESYGVLYDHDKEIYHGLLIKGMPREGKNIIIYDNNNEYIKYQGDFRDYKYHGKGNLYFEYSELIYFSGIFEQNNFIEGNLYSPSGNITYIGKFLNNIPIEGKNIMLYNLDKDLIYEGDFLNAKYHGKGKLYNIEKNNKTKLYEGEFEEGLFQGKGKLFKDKILYYEGDFKKNEIIGKGILYYKNGKKKIEGNFEIRNKNDNFDFYFSKNYSEGKLFDQKGNFLYQTEFIDFYPKEGKNLVIYDSKEENIVYEGDISNYKYHGSGKLYENIGYLSDEYILIYEGAFREGQFHGYGKMYKKFYKDKYYEGNFKNGEFFGKGIKYYKSGAKKMEGTFGMNKTFDVIYYYPNGNDILYKGKIMDDIFYSCEKTIIYNDSGEIIYEGLIKNINSLEYLSEEDYFNYLNNIILSRENYLIKSFSINRKPGKLISSIAFISDNYSGKTSLIERIINDKFIDTPLMGRLGTDFIIYNFILGENKYNLTLCYSHCYQDKFYYINFNILKKSIIIVYTIDSSIENDINENYIYKLYEDFKQNKKILFYIVITKIDNKIDSLVLKFRKIAKKLILEGFLDRYFEVSSKTGEGIKSFINCLKYDCAFLLN